MKYCALLTSASSAAALAESRVDTHFRLGKRTHTLSLSPLMPGDVLLDAVAEALRVPAERMKVVHKGRVVTKETVQALIRPGAAFMVLASQDVHAAAAQRMGEAQAVAFLMSELHLDASTARAASGLAGKLQEYNSLD